MRTVISIALILIGISGIFVVYQSKQVVTPPLTDSTITIREQPTQKEETITVAVAKEDLNEKTILTPDNYELKSITVATSSPEKREYAITTKAKQVGGFAINSPIAQGSMIPKSTMYEPGSIEYIELFKQPGTVIYTFPLEKSDAYLLDNVKEGGFVDVFLIYDRNFRAGGIDEIVSPGNKSNIADVRLKPMMSNKRVLAMRRGSPIVPQSNALARTVQDDLSIVVEITDQEMKILKVLETKALFVLFPSLPEGFEQSNISSLGELESAYPISEESIFGMNLSSIREIRGG